MEQPDTTRVALHDRRPADRRLYGRVLFFALLLSAGFHAVLLLRLGFSVDLPPGPVPPTPLVRIVPAMQAFEISVVGGEVAPIEVQIRQQEERSELQLPSAELPAAPSPGIAAQGEARAGDPRDPALNRLRYRMPTIDVWRPSAPPPRTAAEVMEHRVAARIAAYNDSMAAEAERRERATDWTVRDASGGRWGVSPGAIHLGGITLPLPLELTAGPEKREEVAGRVRTWSEIQRQAVFVETRQIQNDRIRAMRERAAAERAARGGTTTPDSASSGGSGRPPGGGTPPDGGTTGGG